MDAAGLGLLFALIAIALLFDFLNGLHDAANSIATIVSTRVLSPRYAVVWAAFFNFIAFLFFGLHVAATIGTGIVSPSIIDDRGDLRRPDGRHRLERRHLVAGIPSSSSHALIGGLVGAGLCQGRLQCHRLVGPGARPPRPSCCRPPLGFFLAPGCWC